MSDHAFSEINTKPSQQYWYIVFRYYVWNDILTHQYMQCFELLRLFEKSGCFVCSCFFLSNLTFLHKDNIIVVPNATLHSIKKWMKCKNCITCNLRRKWWFNNCSLYTSYAHNHPKIISSKIQVITSIQIYTSVNVDIELKDSPFPYLSMH